MRHSLRQTLSFLAITLIIGGVLTAYVHSETDTPAQTLSIQGVITPRTRALIKGSDAYVLGPPETITDRLYSSMVAISPDADAVLTAGYKAHPYHELTLSKDDANAAMAQRFPELALIYWDTRTRVPQTLFRESVAEGRVVKIESIGWMPQSRTALIVVRRASLDYTESTRTVMRVNSTTGAVSRLIDIPAWGACSVSPTQPLAFVLVGETNKTTDDYTFPYLLRVYTPAGYRNTVRVPLGVRFFNWTQDGKSVFGSKRTTEIVDGKEVTQVEYALIDLSSGAITHPDKRPITTRATSTSPDANSWSVASMEAKTTIPDPTGKAESIPAVWLRAIDAPSAKTNTTTPSPTLAANVLEKPTPSVPPVSNALSTDSLLVATNAESAGLLFGKSTAAVLFVREGALCAAPIFRLPAEDFTRTLRQVQRQATMRNAKQVGLGILQYMQDYDETYPASAGVSDAIFPYVKDKSVFENPASGEFGFTYTMKGGTQSGQEDSLATTQLGFISGVGGQAILWADGHVTWQDAP